MNETDRFMENDSWVVVDAFFNKHGITSQQIESFNDFVDNMIPKILDDVAPIDIEDSNGTRHIFKLCSEGYYLKGPNFIEVTGTTKMYPNTARLRNITYAGELHAKVKYAVMCEGKVTQKNKAQSKVHLIGRIPVMVMSKYCNLFNLKEKEFESLRECPLDPGGYFIVDGKERIVLTQERAANNTVFVFKTYSNSKSILKCEYRSATEDSSASAKAFWVNLLEQPRTCDPKIGMWKRSGKSKEIVIKAAFPGLSGGIDLYILYQAIGFQTQKEMYESIIEVCARQTPEDGESTLQLIIPILLPSLQAWKCMTSEEAKDAIGVLRVRQIQDENLDYRLDPEGYEEREKEDRSRFVENLLSKEFLPHLGTETTNFSKKGLFLSYMVWKLLMVHTGLIPHDDRDHLQNKRYHCSGPLLAQLFHRAVCTLNKEMKMLLLSQVRSGGRINISKAIHPSYITNTLNHCLATGNWGNLREMHNKNSRIYSNVTQELNRYTRNSHLSSLRRLNSPEDKLQLMIKPRQLHNTYFGVICPFETPEGAPIGLVKNMALLAQVTVSVPFKDVIKFLSECGVIELESAVRTRAYLKGLAKVFVDGKWIGFSSNPSDLIVKFKHARKVGRLNSYVSICRDTFENTVEIRADAGRLCRPLLVVRNNKLVLKPIHVKKLREGLIKWDDLLRMGVVEMVDVRESESALIAMDLKALKSARSNGFTHMEIHPALMLGICGSTVPFSNHTQSPRIVYQSGITKQAMGVYVTNFQSRMDSSSHFLHYGHRPIVQTKAMKYFNFNDIPAGAVCIVAIGTWQGYNMEDSIIVNRSAIERGLFRSTMFQTYQEKAEQYMTNLPETSEAQMNEELFLYPSSKVTKGVRIVWGETEQEQMKLYRNIGADGLPVPGEVLGYEIPPNIKLRNWKTLTEEFEMSEEPAIISKVRMLSNAEIDADSKRLSRRDAQGLNIVQSKLKYRDLSKFARKPLFTCVDDVMLANNAKGERIVKVRTRKRLQPTVGDKFASLHGQKGVVGLDFHERDLPFTKDGIVPDIIMNPHGLPSRMTIGQLYESLCGKAAALEGIIIDGTPFHKRELSGIQNLLVKHGFSQSGMEVMYDGRTGRKITSPYFIGPTYYQRLKHLVDDKIHSRARGAVDVITQQPVKGFSRDGGLRFGEMERDCIISHGTALFLMERLLDVSDGRNYAICGNCGFIAANHPVFRSDGRYSSCTHCSQPADDKIEGPPIYTVRMPYAAKLLFQELVSMNIKVRIVPSNPKPIGDKPVFVAEVENQSIKDLLHMAGMNAPKCLPSEREDPAAPLPRQHSQNLFTLNQIQCYDPQYYEENGNQNKD